MSNVEMTKIDGEKLRRELEKRGVSFSDLSVKLRKAEGYISHCIQRGAMCSGTYDLMCLRLGVDEDYFLKPVETVTTQVEPVKDESTETVLELLKETNTLLREMIKMWRYE